MLFRFFVPNVELGSFCPLCALSLGSSVLVGVRASVFLWLCGVAQHSAATAAAASHSTGPLHCSWAQQLPEVQLHLEPAERPRQLRQHCYSDLMLKASNWLDFVSSFESVIQESSEFPWNLKKTNHFPEEPVVCALILYDEALLKVGTLLLCVWFWKVSKEVFN